MARVHVAPGGLAFANVQQLWIYVAAPAIFLPVFVRFGLYRAIFRYTGLATMQTLLKAAVVYGVLLLALVLLTFPAGVPRSVGVLQPILFLVLVSNSRAWARFWLNRGSQRDLRHRLLIYGAGDAGAQTAAAVANAGEFELLGFVDDDATKIGRHINGVPVFAPNAIADTVERLGVSDILLALPSASRQRRHQIIEGLRSLAGSHSHAARHGGSCVRPSVDFGFSRTGPRGPAWARSSPAQLGAAGARPCGQGCAGDRCGRQHRRGALSSDSRGAPGQAVAG